DLCPSGLPRSYSMTMLTRIPASCDGIQRDTAGKGPPRDLIRICEARDCNGTYQIVCILETERRRPTCCIRYRKICSSTRVGNSDLVSVSVFDPVRHGVCNGN